MHEQVQLDNTLDSSTLRKHFEQLLVHYPDLAAVLDGVGMTHDFFSQVLTTRLPPMLAQNITVLWQQKPELYQKGLFCAVLTM